MAIKDDTRARYAGLLAEQRDKIGVCILAAGIAKRLEPISAIIAKPAFPLGGRTPIAELWVRRFVESGLTKMAMNLHRVPQSIRGYFRSGEAFGADIVYVDEESPSGTLGGALKMVRALQKTGFYPERVFIPSGDIVSAIGTEELETMLGHHLERKAAFSLMLAPIPWERRNDFGTVLLEGIAPNQDVAPGTFARVLEFLEKNPSSPSNENNASNYLVETDFLLQLEPYLTEAKLGIEKPCYDFGKHVLMGITGAVPHLGFLAQRKNDFYGYEPGKGWFDVGNKRDYLEVNRAALKGDIALDLPYQKTDWGWLGKGVQMTASRVTIKPPVVIGDGCQIADGAELGPDAVIGDGWKIGVAAKISRAVLWPRYRYTEPVIEYMLEVADGASIDTAIVVGGRVTGEVEGKTVRPMADGTCQITDLDWVPSGDRA
jgi:NDP-sugar pyrophosphorylase family protein